ncbi:MAG: hypothetical protein JWN13_546, partial [Betaproteobacteria bacterium]|nr:hypothetical protein [Betaproteobacteria bacterium]
MSARITAGKRFVLSPSTKLRTCLSQREQLSARWLLAAMLGAVAFVIAGNVSAQYPNRPLRYVVPQAPGSASDTSARIVAFELTRILGQQVIVDNRPGGGLTIGIDMVVRASPDGYTI